MHNCIIGRALQFAISIDLKLFEIRFEKYLQSRNQVYLQSGILKYLQSDIAMHLQYDILHEVGQAL